MRSKEQQAQEELTEVHWKGRTVRYCTSDPNALWRARTLFSKEPSTIEWLSEIKAGETLLDVGANVGMYSLFAAAYQEATVYAFEPESQNYALLNKNIHANALSHRVTAYCLACSDTTGFTPLHLSEFKPGSSCHSLGEEVDFNLLPRPSAFTQGSYAITIDDAIRSGAVPIPDHIKLDVDGFEHRVLAGASDALGNSKVRSLIIEINPAISEHMEAVFALSILGFSYDEQQAEKATRKHGPFKGIGEWIFRRTAYTQKQVAHHAHYPPLPRQPGTIGQGIQDHVLSRIRSTAVNEKHFPISIVDNVFPDDYYQKILEHFPSDHQLTPINKTGRTTGSTYEQRLVALLTKEGLHHLTEEQGKFWTELTSWLHDAIFIEDIVDHFRPHLGSRLARIHEANAGPALLRGDALLVSDRSNYAIGPHTDAAHRLISFLFYLPADSSQRHLGTSLYTPKKIGQTCTGEIHHNRDQFNITETIDYLPNRLVIFPRTDSSFHGVEPITDQSPQRHLLINNIRIGDR